MAKSPAKHSQAGVARAPKPPGKAVSLLSFIFRLLLLGVGGGLAWVLGMGAAQFYPSGMAEMPLAEKAFRQMQNFASGGGKRVAPPPSPAVVSPTPAPASVLSLSSTQKQKLQTELRQLQGELNALIGRTAALETQLGTSRPTESVEQRLQTIAQQLAASETTPPSQTNSSSPQLPAKAQSGEQQTLGTPIFSDNALMVTLPSDVLFLPGSSVLRPGTNAILDNLIADLRNYEGASVRIAGHTDDAGDASQNRELSLTRAIALQQYLSKTLGESKYHWVAIGYGSSRPSVENTSEANRQRNRRLEVAIAP